MTSIIIIGQSSPVEHLKSVVIAVLKFLKLTISSSICYPNLMLLNRNCVRFASMKKKRKIRPKTFISFGIE